MAIKKGIDEEKIRLFISSVQKELEPERLAIVSLVKTDLFLDEHIEPVLFDKEPVFGKKAAKPYLDCLDTCRIYLLMINRQYGRSHGQLSATHDEYRHAQKKGLPTLVFVKGHDDDLREGKTRDFFEEIKEDGYTYKRFIDRLDLRTEVRAALLRLLKEDFNVIPTVREKKMGIETIEASSSFETLQTDHPWTEIDQKVTKDWLSDIGELGPKAKDKKDVKNILRTRGLLWLDRESLEYYALAAGILFIGRNPALAFPQCRILVDAYPGEEPGPNPNDQLTISLPAPKAVHTVLDFIHKNTRHPPRIIGLNRITLDEYPEEAVREAIVNAIAHRNYEDRARSILVEVFFNRVVISSPGLPPNPLNLTKLRRGKYRPCSRNPVLAQCLASLKLMEQRGSGLGRMKSAMLDHGLDAPEFEIVDGYFQVTLRGPADDLNRLRITPDRAVGAIPPSLEATLNKRQKKIIAQILSEGYVTTSWCIQNLKIVKDTARRDFNDLISKGVLDRVGQGRRTRYVMKTIK